MTTVATDTSSTTAAQAAAVADRDALLNRLEQEVGVMVRRIRRILGEQARAAHPELQGSTYLILTWIEQHGPVRPSAIAETFAIDKGAISRQVQHLIELGLVERTPDPGDGRATLVSASPAAVRRLREVEEQSRHRLDTKLNDLADGELEQFVGLLSRYNAALDA